MSPQDWQAQAAAVLAASVELAQYAEAGDWDALDATEADRRPRLAALLPPPAGVEPAAALAFVEAVLAADRQTARRVGEARDEVGRRLRGLVAGARAVRAYGA